MKVLIGAPTMAISRSPISRYAVSIFKAEPTAIEMMGRAALVYACRMALVTVIRQDSVTDTPRSESRGAAIAIASSSPANKSRRIGSENKVIPQDAGIATKAVSRRASVTDSVCPR